MNCKIMILNLVRYTKNNEQKGIVNFIFADDKSIANSTNMKGYTVARMFTRNADFFNSVPIDIIGKTINAQLEERTSYNNPLEKRSYIKCVEYKGAVYDL